VNKLRRHPPSEKRSRGLPHRCCERHPPGWGTCDQPCSQAHSKSVISFSSRQLAPPVYLEPGRVNLPISPDMCCPRSSAMMTRKEQEIC
jgi:hypothetical protein